MKYEIPKIIHYCWFGGSPLGELELKCIESWRKFFPEYKIIQWNEANFDVNECQYVHEAYELKKWAFVSDYARFSIINRFGGLYFDTDVEVIRSFGDITKSPFMGFETDPNSTNGTNGMVNPGLGFGGYSHMPLFNEILDSYTRDSFLIGNKINYTTVVERVTGILQEQGLSRENGIQCVGEMRIYPSCYFSPINPVDGVLRITSETRSIHRFSATWQPESIRELGKIKQIIRARYHRLPNKAVAILAWIVYLLKTGNLSALHHRF